jgi:hypothetical protein
MKPIEKQVISTYNPAGFALTVSSCLGSARLEEAGRTAFLEEVEPPK